LRPAASSLTALAADADPLTKTLDGSAANLLSVMQNWALAIQTRDSASHLFRVSLSFTPDLLRQLDAYVKGPPAPGAKRRRRPSSPRPASGDVTRPLNQVPKAVRPVLDRVANPVNKTLDRATGDSDVKPLLDFLLGR
jgi:hypothetical protein